jgi:predicted acyl esterase
MRVSGRLARTVGALALFAGVAPVGLHAAVAGGPAYRTIERYVTVADGPGGHHHVRLDTRLYIPAGVSAARPAPAILTTNGFGGSINSSDVTSNADFFARHGYVVLAYTSQGFGKSGGCIELDSLRYDATDATDLISQVLAPRRDVLHDARGPVVGMVGGSYGGGITLVVAEHDPRIRAIAPSITWNSLQYSLIPDNVVLPHDPTGFTHSRNVTGVFKGEWTSLFFADGNAQPAEGDGGCPQEKAASGSPTTVAGVPCLGFPTNLCQAYAEVASTGELTPGLRALLAQSSGSTWIHRLRVPTLLIQGEQDTLFNLDDAAATYLQLRREHVPVELIWESGGHGYPGQPGEGDVYGGGTSNLDRGYITMRELAWFDRWLRHRDVKTGPGFAFFENWVPYRGAGPDTVQFGVARAFPAERLVRFGLSAGYAGGGILSPPGHPVVSGSYTFYRAGAPSYSETSDCSSAQAGAPCPGPVGSMAPALEAPGGSVSFTSQPFNVPVVSVGIPLAHIHLSHLNGQDLVFFAKVYDVGPGGATLIDRLVAPVRVPNSALGAAVNFHLLGFAHRFAAGHEIRLVLAAADATSVLGATGNEPDAITVSVGAPPGFNDPYYGGGPDPSWFALPVAVPASVQPWYGAL